MPTKAPVILGIDYGSTHIGLAFASGKAVMPLTVISGKNSMTAIKEISRYALENKVEKIVIGLPLNEEGKNTYQSLKVRKFAKLLRIKLKKPIEFVNEMYSSYEAALDMIAEQTTKKSRRENDQYAAAIILKRYIAENG